MILKANLQRLVLKIFFVFVSLCLIFFLAACSGKNNSSQTSSFFDETEEAGKLVLEANGLLKQVKQRLGDNEDRRDELKAALKGKDVGKVKVIADELVTQINK